MTKQRETRERVLELIEPLGVGDAIPSERQLGIDLGVSRLTVRAALDELVREGYLVRRRGAGTFVAEPKVAKGIDITSFSDDMRARGLTPGSRTLELRTIPAGARLGRILHVSPSEPVVVGQAPAPRRRRADGDRAAARPRVARARPHGDATSRRTRSTTCSPAATTIAIVGGTQTVEPTVTNEEESQALGVPLHSPALLFERVTRTDGRRDRRVHELDLPRRPLPARDRDRRRRQARSSRSASPV